MTLANTARRPDDAGAAIQNVLEADRQGAQRVAQCHRLAAQKLAAARTRAEAISRRADERVAQLQVRYLKLTDERVALLEGAALQTAATPSAEIEPVTAAAEQLAVMLTSSQ
ncbi:MAG: hypothetical protein ACLP7P_11335 [Rhodomicrobium sp.]